MAVSQKLINKLNDLLVLDLDAVEAYDQVIRRMESESCKSRLRTFQADHKRHVSELRDCIKRYEGQPREHKDLRGVVVKGITALQSLAGDEAALKALQASERFTNGRYAEAAADPNWPEDVRTMVQGFRDDEDRHLAWIGDAINGRLWEPPELPPSIPV